MTSISGDAYRLELYPPVNDSIRADTRACHSDHPALLLPDDLRKREESTFNPPKSWDGFVKQLHGGKQELFNRSGLKSVERICSTMRQMVEDGRSLEKTLPQILQFVACKDRYVLAKAQGAYKAESFGKWIGTPGSYDVNFTVLDEHYQEYGNRVLAHLQEKMREILKEKGSDSSKGTLWKGWGDDKSRYYVRIINKQEIASLSKPISAGGLNPRALCRSKDGFDIGYSMLPDVLKVLGEQFPSNHKDFINLKSTFVVGICLLKVDGVWKELSAHLTWAYEDSAFCITDKVVERMNLDRIRFSKDGSSVFKGKNSQVILCHGLKRHIDSMADHICRLTAKALRWDGVDTRVLNATIGEIHNALNQQMIAERGTAAIAEVWTRALYKFHGFELVPPRHDIRIDLETHVLSSVTNFVKKYPMLYAEDPTSRRSMLRACIL
jgi:hypothetical protein